MASITSREKRPREAQAAAAAFGASLKEARSKQGLTLREVAESSKLSIAYLSDLERGVLQNPTLNALQAIARAVSTPLNELLGVDPPDDREPPLPEPLREFANSDTFRTAIEADAKKRNAEPEALQRAWLSTLGRIELVGRRPRESADYFLLFEAIRRTID